MTESKQTTLWLVFFIIVLGLIFGGWALGNEAGLALSDFSEITDLFTESAFWINAAAIFFVSLILFYLIPPFKLLRKAKAGTQAIVISLILIGSLIGAYFLGTTPFFSPTIPSIAEIFNAFQTVEFWINTGVILLVGILFIYLVPPFKALSKAKAGTQFAALFSLLLVSVSAAIFIGDKFVSEAEAVQSFFLDNAGQITVNSLANVAIFWFLLALILPEIWKRWKAFQSNGRGGTSKAFIVVTLILAVLLSTFFNPAGLWEDEGYTSVEQFLLGDKDESGYSGYYQDDEGERSYGILAFWKVPLEEKGFFGDENVIPLVTLIVSSLLLILAYSMFIGSLSTMAGKFIGRPLLAIIISSITSAGTTFTAVIAIGYYILVAILSKKLFKETKSLWISVATSLFALDTLASVLNDAIEFGGDAFFMPPLFENIWWRLGGTLGIALLLKIGKDSFSQARKSIGSLYRCKLCKRFVKRKGTKFICSSCSYTCNHCGARSADREVTEYICKNPVCAFRGRDVGSETCPGYKGTPNEHQAVLQKSTRNVCTACNREVKTEIPVEEISGLEILGAYIGPGLVNWTTSTAFDTSQSATVSAIKGAAGRKADKGIKKVAKGMSEDTEKLEKNVGELEKEAA